MKRQLILRLSFIIIIFKLTPKPSHAQASFIINNLDSVVYDIEQSTISGGYVEFPVSFLSDDSIYALDFSFKYNQLNFLYDSVINLTPGLSMLANYNTNDSTVRVTSYSLATLPNDSPIVRLRFQILTGTFCNADMNTVKGYLNGDFCSNKLVNCNTTGISENEFDNMFEVFPNPSKGKIFINVKYAKAWLTISDLYGKKVLPHTKINTSQQLDLPALSKGIYFLSIEQNERKAVRKLLIE